MRVLCWYTVDCVHNALEIKGLLFSGSRDSKYFRPLLFTGHTGLYLSSSFFDKLVPRTPPACWAVGQFLSNCIVL